MFEKSIIELLLSVYEYKIPCSIILHHLNWEDIILLASCSKTCKIGISNCWKEMLLNTKQCQSIFSFLYKLKSQPLEPLMDCKDTNSKEWITGCDNDFTKGNLKDIRDKLIEISNITDDVKLVYSIERKLFGLKKFVYKTLKNETFTSIKITSVYSSEISNEEIDESEEDGEICPVIPFKRSLIDPFQYDSYDSYSWYDSLLEYRNEKNEIIMQIGTQGSHPYLKMFPYDWVQSDGSSDFPLIDSEHLLQNVLPFYSRDFSLLNPSCRDDSNDSND